MAGALPNPPPNPISDIRAMMLAFPDTLSTEPHKGPSEKGRENSKAESDEEGGSFNLHHKYLRAMQSEALDDFYTDIKRHLWHLDYTLVRNFQVTFWLSNYYISIAPYTLGRTEKYQIALTLGFGFRILVTTPYIKEMPKLRCLVMSRGP